MCTRLGTKSTIEGFYMQRWAGAVGHCCAPVRSEFGHIQNTVLCYLEGENCHFCLDTASTKDETHPCATQWSTAFLSKVNFPYAIDFRASSGANLVT